MLLGIYYTSVSARSEADAAIVNRREPDCSARGALPAATLVTLAMDEMMYLGSAATAGDLAERLGEFRIVRVLAPAQRLEGGTDKADAHCYDWDGTDEAGNPVGPGVYRRGHVEGSPSLGRRVPRGAGSSGCPRSVRR